MTHVTLNTGHSVHHPPELLPAEVMDALRPILQRSEGMIPGCAPWSVSIFRPPGAPPFSRSCVFSIYRGKQPVVTCGVGSDDGFADEVWDGIEALYMQVSDSNPKATASTAVPDQPDTPWLAVVLLPTISLVAPSDLDWLGDFERTLATAILD